MNAQIICPALNALKDQPEGVEAVKQIVAVKEFYLLPDAIISTALNILKDQPEGVAAAKNILAVEKFYLLHDAIISTALNLLKDQPEGLVAAKQIVTMEEFYLLPHAIISNALKVLKDQPEGLAAAKQILAVDEFYLLPKEIISNALKLLKDDTAGLTAANKILQLPNVMKLPDDMLSVALQVAQVSDVALEVASAIKAKGITKQINLMFAAIRTLCLSAAPQHKKLLEDIYQQIKLGIKDKNSPGVYKLYQDLFYLPLMDITAHRQRIFGLLKHYKPTQHFNGKKNIYRVLNCYTREYAQYNQLKKEISEVQIRILKNAIADINYQLKNHPATMHTGHIDIALGNLKHSSLKNSQVQEQSQAIVELIEQSDNTKLKQNQLYKTALAIVTGE